MEYDSINYEPIDEEPISYESIDDSYDTTDYEFMNYQEIQQPFNQQPFNQESVIRIENGRIVHVFRQNRQNGFITVSYEDSRNRRGEELVTLLVTPQTVIQNASGRQLNLDDLRMNMTVNAIFSSRMTRSIPPQALAFLITVVERRERTITTEGRVIDVNRRNNTLEIRERRGIGRDDRDDRDGRRQDERFDDDNDVRDTRWRDNDQRNRIRFEITDNTILVNRRGREIELRNIRPDDQVRVEYFVRREPRRPDRNIAVRVERLDRIN